MRPEAGAAVRGLAIGPEQPDTRILPARHVPSRDMGVPHDEFARQPGQQEVQVLAVPDVRHEGPAALGHRRPVQTVHPGIAEEVAVDAHALLEDLRPLRARFGAHLHLARVEAAVPGFGGSATPTTAQVAGCPLAESSFSPSALTR